MYEKARYLPSGDSALVMELGNSISPQINRRIREIVHLLEREAIDGVVEWISTYRSITLIYDPVKIGYSELVDRLKKIEKQRGNVAFPPPVITEIPTVYGGEYGPDIQFVAEHNGLSVEEVIRIHSSTNYLIYMLGFTPGFVYLGGMSEKIVSPRLKTPREKISAGSVGIAAKQTGIYPIDSPGGWQLIGRTPVKLFDPGREQPVLLKAGNYLRFIPVSFEKYRKIEEEIKEGKYEIKTYPLEEGEQHRY